MATGTSFCTRIPFLRLTAVFFVVTDYIGSRLPLYHLQAIPNSQFSDQLPLDWKEIMEMSEDMDIGSHSCSHRSVGSLSDMEAAAELFESKNLLEEHLGKPIEHFSYPFGSKAYGHFTDKTTELLQKFGYKTACTTVVGTNKEPLNFYALKRIPVEASDSLFDLECKLSGAYDWVGPFKTLFQRTFSKPHYRHTGLS
jgi:peptidoglycan/xylan/chitin deacetylase (PgdA/CDA1 family)